MNKYWNLLLLAAVVMGVYLFVSMAIDPSPKDIPLLSKSGALLWVVCAGGGWYRLYNFEDEPLMKSKKLFCVIVAASTIIATITVESLFYPPFIPFNMWATAGIYSLMTFNAAKNSWSRTK